MFSFSRSSFFLLFDFFSFFQIVFIFSKIYFFVDMILRKSIEKIRILKLEPQKFNFGISWEKIVRKKNS